MTFLSDLRQPEVDLFVPLSHDFEQLSRQIASMRVKTPSNTNLVASGLIKKREWLTSGTRASLKNVAA